MRCLVTSFGSAGDFLPTLALGAALRRRGHEVRFVANPFYESRARSAGLDLIPAGADCDLYARFEENPEYGHARNLHKLFKALIAPNSVATYPVILDVLQSEPVDVVIGNDGTFAAFWAAKAQNVPSVLVHASPMIWINHNDPVALGDRSLPPWLARPAIATASVLISVVATRWLRVVAQEIGIATTDISLRGTERMAALRLGLWSPTLRPPADNDPPNGRICGFTRSSRYGGVRHELAANVEAFLGSGPPPVVVGFGSAFSRISGPVLTSIAEACAARNLRCLIVGHPSGLTFPSNTLAVPYAPYDEVFPRAAAVAVHCGAGTTGEALRCGKPIIGVPFAFDQFGLCAAIEKLGVGVRAPSAKRSRADFVRVLDRVLTDDRLRQRAAAVGPQFSGERDGAQCGADAVEQLIASRRAAQ